jgi:hypothetical protein
MGRTSGSHTRARLSTPLCARLRLSVERDILEHMFEVEAQAEVSRWVTTLAVLPRDVVSDSDRVDRIRELEDLKAAAAAAQVRLTADLDTSQRRAQTDAGVPARRVGEGIASQVALARRESPVRGAQHLDLSKVLTTEMPDTLGAMTDGRLSEWRATLLVRETACLSAADRRIVDAALCADPRTLEGLSDRALVAEAKRLAYRLDPESVVRRNRNAETARTVTIRPAPDTMSWVTALLPVTQGVAVYAALTHEANRLRAAGDPRGRGQVMADTLVGRIIGQPATQPVPLSVGLVITDRTLFGAGNEPATLEGYGVVPADWARDHVTTAASEGVAWFRRIYTAPKAGDLVGMDSQAQHFPTGLARFIDIRDGDLCRTPWCGAPIRHHDHVVPRHADGPTTATNGQGLCERCNYAKEAPGWHSRPRPGPRHTVVVTTPTGHTHTSTAPPLPGTPTRRLTRMDIAFTDLVLSA